MRQLPNTYNVTEIACMDYRDNRTFVDKSEYDRLAAEVERLTKERDDDRKREYGYSQQTVDALQSTIAQKEGKS